MKLISYLFVGLGVVIGVCGAGAMTVGVNGMILAAFQVGGVELAWAGKLVIYGALATLVAFILFLMASGK